MVVPKSIPRYRGVVVFRGIPFTTEAGFIFYDVFMFSEPIIILAGAGSACR